MPPRGGYVKIFLLWFHRPSMRTSGVNVYARIGPGVDLAFINSTTVSLSYDRALIGEATLEDSYIIPGGDIIVSKLEDVEIHDMTGFKTFIRHLMPRAKPRYLPEGGAPGVALEIVENGHKLSMAINLDSMGAVRTTMRTVRRTRDEIEITFSVQNPTTVGIYFGNTHFILQRERTTLARLQGHFGIEHEALEREYILKGNIEPNCTLFGSAILKGDSLDEEANTWFIHAIRQFEMEVNLDEAVTSEN
ncbi:hypothetical protein ACHAQJ_003902 [Trichoderma viride]